VPCRKGIATVRLQDGTIHKAEVHWYEVGKLYRILPDQDAEKHGYLRIVDESGEDYGYAARRFFVIDLPKPLEKVLLGAAS